MVNPTRRKKEPSPSRRSKHSHRASHSPKEKSRDKRDGKKEKSSAKQQGMSLTTVGLAGGGAGVLGLLQWWLLGPWTAMLAGWIYDTYRHLTGGIPSVFNTFRWIGYQTAAAHIREYAYTYGMIFGAPVLSFLGWRFGIPLFKRHIYPRCEVDSSNECVDEPDSGSDSEQDVDDGYVCSQQVVNGKVVVVCHQEGDEPPDLTGNSTTPTAPAAAPAHKPPQLPTSVVARPDNVPTTIVEGALVPAGSGQPVSIISFGADENGQPGDPAALSPAAKTILHQAGKANRRFQGKAVEQRLYRETKGEGKDKEERTAAMETVAEVDKSEAGQRENHSRSWLAWATSRSR